MMVFIKHSVFRAHNTAIATNSEPTLNLQVDVKPFSVQPDWESQANNNSILTSVVNNNIQQSIGAGQKYVQNKLPGLIMNHMEKTFSIVSRALTSVVDDSTTSNYTPRSPLSDNEFRYYCDSVGQIIHQKELRKVIYSGGIEPSLRRVVWKHILNVYPSGLTGKERMDYMKRKSAEYYKMREIWRTAVMEQGKAIKGELAYVTSMVRKDVLRTDRHHAFYAGNDDNQNIGALFNVLTTYALNHPSVSYCQGMSDMASPLLVTMCDEAQAYICFCALMSRMKFNFMIDGIAMTKKFAHLSEALQYYDMEFYNYLKLHQADDLLFCYRWLLLEMKREFAFDDSLRMLEVLWSSLPENQPDTEIPLFEKEFIVTEEEPIPLIPALPLLIAESPYTKVCALRRQNSALSISSNQLNVNPKLDVTRRMNQSMDETSRETYRRNLRKAHQSLDESKLLLLHQKHSISSDSAPPGEITDAPSIDDISEEKNPFLYSDSTDKELPSGSDNSAEMKTINRNSSVTETLKELREKLVASKIGISNAIDHLEEAYDPLNVEVKEVKLVKNFSEFLNFAKKSSDNETLSEVICETLTVDSNNESKNKDETSPDDEYFPVTTSVTRELKIDLDSLNRQLFGQTYHQQIKDESPLENIPAPDKPPYLKLQHQASSSLDAIEIDNGENDAKIKLRKSAQLNDNMPINRFSGVGNNDVFIWQNPLCGSNDCLQSKTPTPNQATTPDEQAEIEYDGEIIEMNQGKKSVTPIRLVRKNNQASNRNSAINADSDSEENDPKWNINSNNPFYEQIKLLNKTKCDDPVSDQPSCEQTLVNSCEEASEIAQTSVAENQPPNEVPPNEQATSSSSSSICQELPSPSDFGNGNPFLMFLCLTLLLQHRDFIMRSNMDYNEMAMHFDKMVRKHNVTKVLSQARKLYQDYIRRCNERTKNSTNAKD